jgi:hypothetical protein
MSENNGIILVWDLDQTIVANFIDIQNDSDILRIHYKEQGIDKYKSADELGDMLIINEAVIPILREIHEAKKSGAVSANLLLTNNASIVFIALVQYTLNRRYRLDVDIFDMIMQRGSLPAAGELIPRQLTPAARLQMAKNINNVKRMIEKINENPSRSPKISTENLLQRTYFIDDQPHPLSQQLEERSEITGMPQYIKITPGFTPDIAAKRAAGDPTAANATNFNALMKVIKTANIGAKFKSATLQRMQQKAAAAAAEAAAASEGGRRKRKLKARTKTRKSKKSKVKRGGGLDVPDGALVSVRNSKDPMSPFYLIEKELAEKEFIEASHY